MPAASRLALSSLALKITHDKVDDFYSSWKDYQRKYKVNGKDKVNEDVADMVHFLMDSDHSDDEGSVQAAPEAKSAAAPAVASGPDPGPE